MRFSMRLAVFVFAAMTSLFSAEQQPFKEPATGLIFPVKLGEWTKNDEQSLGGGQGILVSYNKGETKATLSVYNLGLKSIPHDIDSDILKDHYAKSKSEMAASSEQRGTVAIKIKDDDINTRKDDDSSKFLRVIYELKAKTGRELYSHLYLSDYKNQFFRIRINYPKPIKAEGEKATEELLNEVGKLLKN